MTHARDAELETNIMVLESPYGNDADIRASARAAAWLLAHADRAYPALLERLRTGTASAAIVELLPDFERTESITELESLLRSEERLAWTAGQALARHVGVEALEALRRSVHSEDPNVVVAAAGGLAARGDKSACADLVAVVAHPDARVRYQTVQAAGKLDCLKPEELEVVASHDSSADVRELALRFLKA